MILPWLISRIVLVILSGNHCDHIGLKKIDIFPVLGHPCLKDHKLKNNNFVCHLQNVHRATGL